MKRSIENFIKQKGFDSESKYADNPRIISIMMV